MKDLIIILILAAIFGSAAWYIRKSKKSGKKCIGCPNSCCCSAKMDGQNCSHDADLHRCSCHTQPE